MQNGKNTEILKVKGDWLEVVDDCRATVGKETLGKEPSTGFKKKILIAEHSPIRDISIKWRWRDIPSWVATHWSRHKFEKYIKTQRSDRTGIDRRKLPQDAPVTFTGDANTQQLIDAWRKRLCYQASPETRAYAVNFKKTLHEVEPELADVLTCNCVYRAFCPEMNPCGFWKEFSKDLSKEDVLDWRIRYGRYNEKIYSSES